MADKTETTETITPSEILAPGTGEGLPGEQEADSVLLDQAVAHINQLYIAKGLETARVIGEYVLTTFFGGDTETFRAKGSKHTSFRALAEREDLHVSHVWIWRAVSVVDQLQLLPEDVAGSLPFTHHTPEPSPHLLA